MRKMNFKERWSGGGAKELSKPWPGPNSRKKKGEKGKVNGVRVKEGSTSSLENRLGYIR